MKRKNNTAKRKFSFMFRSLWKQDWYFYRYSTEEMGTFWSFRIEPFSLFVTQESLILVILNFQFVFDYSFKVERKGTGCPVSGG